jgi:hypothetical protein
VASQEPFIKALHDPPKAVTKLWVRSNCHLSVQQTQLRSVDNSTLMIHRRFPADFTGRCS